MCTFWGLAGRYRDTRPVFFRAWTGTAWKGPAGRAHCGRGILAGHRDCLLLSQLLRLSDPANQDEVERPVAVEALARATVVPPVEAIKADKRPATLGDMG